jgi:hypothetical protein
MWQIYYVRALDIAKERMLEAERERSARRAHLAAAKLSRVDWLRREGALVAAGVARRLDACVAQEALAGHATNDRVGSAT